MSQIVLDKLKAKFGSRILETHSFKGDDTAIIAPADWFVVAEFLKNDAVCDMSMFIDITAVDYPKKEDRFELVLHLYSLHKGHRVRLKTRLFDETDAAGDPAKPSRVPTLVKLWAAANWFEREVWDMFGIRFEGHPDLRRILMYEEFQGHPLRKDYAADRTQPLVPYRPEAKDKLPPFRADEGMPFGRRDWQPRDDAWAVDDIAQNEKHLAEAIAVDPAERSSGS
jgi:NADH-quinone oxidoreductase subunit C